MGRSKQDYLDATFDSDGNFNPELTIEDREYLREQRGESKAAYVAPKGDQKWRARDLIDIHWELTRMPWLKAPFAGRHLRCHVGGSQKPSVGTWT